MKEESNNIRLNKIKELKKQIESTKKEISLLEQRLANPSDFLRFSSDKAPIAVLALSQAFLSESEKMEEQIKILQIEHNEKIFQFEKSISEEKVKLRGVLSRLEEEIKGNEQTPKKALDNSTDQYYSNVPVPEAGNTENDIEISQNIKDEKAPEDYSLAPPEAGGFWEEDVYETENIDDSIETEKGEIIFSEENTSKYAFIVGKFAGENIFDESGKLIIAKDEVITEEVVENAEAEGKLINLIIDMKLA